MEDTYKALDMPEKPVFEDEISHKKFTYNNKKK